jgi:NADH-quinone oxidoreductase subunit M
MIYERLHTREMAQMSGLARVMPVWGFFMVFFVLASVALPGLNGFVGEFLTLLGTFASDQTLGIPYAAVAALGMIVAAIYLLYLVGRVIFGPVKVPAHHGEHGEGHGHAQHGLADLNRREIAVLAPIAVMCLVLGVYPAPVLDSLEAPVAQITAPAKAAAGVEPVRTVEQSANNAKQVTDARDRKLDRDNRAAVSVLDYRAEQGSAAKQMRASR